MRRSVAGFTLIELLTALALSGFVVLMVSRLLAVVTSSARALDDARVALDREQNGRRWLRSALGSLDPNAHPGGFKGRRDRLTFTAWLEQPGGWFGARRVTIMAAEGTLMASGGAAGTVRLADSVVSLRRAHWGNRKIINDEQIKLGQLGEFACKAAIAVCDLQLIEEPSGAHIQH